MKYIIAVLLILCLLFVFSCKESSRINHTKVVDVINPITERTWMDRNLGANQVAISSTDSLAFGDLYQWGRSDDGHQIRKSDTTSVLSSSSTPDHEKFILVSVAPGEPWNWFEDLNDNIWQGINGVNNPCPNGYRLPTEAEWEEEIQSWNSRNAIGAFNSVLKLPLGGSRSSSNGSIGSTGSNGSYWTSDVEGPFARALSIDDRSSGLTSSLRAIGLSVRCIKKKESEVQ